MKTSVVGLRYKVNEILNALARREQVEILYRGKVKGVIVPAEQGARVKASDHPFFGMTSDKSNTVKQAMENLRGRRYRRT